MPELPEVETVRRGLENLVVGKIVSDVLVYYPKIITNDISEFKKKLQGQKLESVKRRGKFLIFKFTDYDLLSHLRMEGKFQLIDELSEVNNHIHVIFSFKDGTNLAYKDVRKFGRMTLFKKDAALRSKALQQLGPEPTLEEFDLETFKQKLSKINKPIKVALLEQKLVTGLGNIYVDEVLFKSRIHPKRPANLLTNREIEKLRQEIIDTLALAIQYKGTTIRSYENAFGENGTYQNHLEVYGKEQKPCVNCGTLIEKIKLGGRGTHFCPKCQK